MSPELGLSPQRDDRLYAFSNCVEMRDALMPDVGDWGGYSIS